MFCGRRAFTPFWVLYKRRGLMSLTVIMAAKMGTPIRNWSLLFRNSTTNLVHWTASLLTGVAFDRKKPGHLRSVRCTDIILNKITLQLGSRHSRQILSIITNSRTKRIPDPQCALLAQTDRPGADISKRSHLSGVCRVFTWKRQKSGLWPYNSMIP